MIQLKRVVGRRGLSDLMDLIGGLGLARGEPVSLNSVLSRCSPTIRFSVRSLIDRQVFLGVLLLKYEDGSVWVVKGPNFFLAPQGYYFKPEPFRRFVRDCVAVGDPLKIFWDGKMRVVLSVPHDFFYARKHWFRMLVLFGLSEPFQVLKRKDLVVARWSLKVLEYADVKI